MRVTEMREVMFYRCDGCGREMRRPKNLSLTMYFGREVGGEWITIGDYCEECASALRDAVYDNVPLIERYCKPGEKFEMDECIAAERKTIEKYKGVNDDRD